MIKRKEDVASCARREVEEEIGLDVELISEPAVVVDSRPQRIDVVFRARPAPGVDAAAAHARSAELREVAWFPAGELPELQHEAVSALMALASSALGPVERGATDDDGEGEAGSDAALVWRPLGPPASADPARVLFAGSAALATERATRSASPRRETRAERLSGSASTRRRWCAEQGGAAWSAPWPRSDGCARGSG